MLPYVTYTLLKATSCPTLHALARPILVLPTTRTSSSRAATQPYPAPPALEYTNDGKKLKVMLDQVFFSRVFSASRKGVAIKGLVSKAGLFCSLDKVSDVIEFHLTNLLTPDEMKHIP